MSVDKMASVELRRSFSWRVLAAAAGMVSTLVLTVVVVRTLDAHEAATFFAILAALSFGSKIGCLGMGPNVIRLVAAEPDVQAGRTIAGTHLQATFLLTCLSAPVIALIGCNGLIGHGSFWPAFVITTLLIVIESTRLMIGDIFTAAGRVRASVATMHYVRSTLALPVVAIVMFVTDHDSLVAVLAAYLAVAGVQYGFVAVYARSHVSFTRLRAGWSTLRPAVRDGAQLFSLDITEFMMLQGTIWLATAMFSPAVATQYAAAVTLAMQVTILESLAALALAAPAARLWAAGKRDAVIRMLSNAATLSAVIVVAVVGFLAVLGEVVVELAYGPSMGPAALMLLILAVGGIVQAAFKCSITLLVVTGSIKAAARTAILLFAIAAPCAVAAAYFGGPIELAVVTSVSIAVMATGQWLTARKVLGWSPHAHANVVRAARELVRDREVEPAGLEPDAVRTETRTA